MPTQAKLYVGLRDGAREVFRSVLTPTFHSHGEKYNAVIGPFQTKRGAEFMAKYGQGNPHVQCVADAERIARKIAREEACE